MTQARKLLLVFGTRPEAIKMAPVVRALQVNPAFDVRVCVTGQHREMLDQVLSLFEIVPDYDLNDALGAANLLVALVDHSEFKQIPLSQVTSKVVIDTRGLW